MKRGTGAAPKLLLALLLSLLCAAPTPGDVGGCGQRAQALDAKTFFASKQGIDCERCRDCRLDGRACERACAPELAQNEFAEDCLPLVHDGEVCLRALLDASCGSYRKFMSDDAPETATECNFCPTESP